MGALQISRRIGERVVLQIPPQCDPCDVTIEVIAIKSGDRSRAAKIEITAPMQIKIRFAEWIGRPTPVALKPGEWPLEKHHQEKLQ